MNNDKHFKIWADAEKCNNFNDLFLRAIEQRKEEYVKRIYTHLESRSKEDAIKSYVGKGLDNETIKWLGDVLNSIDG